MSRENSPLFVGSDTVKKSTVVFDSDSDSINTDSTAESEARDEYEVERILLEETEPEHRFLVKWEGYKLFRSTWEPPESLVGGEILAEWGRQKKRIAAGEAEPFNYDVYMREFDQAEAEKKAKRQRRNAKRRKRGLPIPIYSSDEEANVEEVDDREISDGDANDLSMATSSYKRKVSPKKSSPKAAKKTKKSDAVRKGIAKKLTRTRTRTRVVSETSSSDDGSSSDESQSSSADTLQEELAARASRPSARTREAVKPRSENAHSRTTSSGSATTKAVSTPIPKRPATSAADKLKSATGTEDQVVLQAPHKAGPSGAARKSAPSHVAADPAKKVHDVFANWDNPKERRERQRVSGATPKYSTEPKFTSLSVQGRYQKYGRENERAPDINALTFIDPRTGKEIPSRATTQPGSTKEVPSAYQRRTPPLQERRRSLTPPSSNRASALPGQFTSHNSGCDTRPICRRWLTTGCTRPSKDCNSIHPLSKSEINHFIDRRRITCFYWLQRDACAYGSGCDFAHSDTGIYSSPPKSGGGFFTVNLPPPEAPPDPPPPPPPPPPPASTTQQHCQPKDNPERPGSKSPGHPACRDWLQGYCPHSADICPWAHTLPTEPYRGNLANIPKHQLLCYYWSIRGTCDRGNSCAFSHVDTGVRAGPPKTGIEGRTSVVPESSARVPRIPSRTVSVSSELPRRSGSVNQVEADTKRALTCFFWRTRGKCAKSDEQCEYAHHHTGLWAAPPPGYKGDREDAQQQAINANMTPVAARRGMSSTTQAIASSPVQDNAGPQSIQPSEELVRSPIEIQAPTMPPPGRENPLRRPSISTPAGSLAAALTISYMGDRTSTLLQVKLELSELHIFGKLAGADPQLHVERAVLASDFRTLIWDEQLRESESTVGSIVISNVATGQRLVDLCKQHTIGLIAMQADKETRMLIYPPSDDVWKFLDIGSNWKTESAFRFRLFSEMPGIEDVSPSAPLQLDSLPEERQPAVLTGEELARLDSTRMQPVKDKMNQGARTVFLMFPPAHHAELEFYGKFFGGQKYRVYHPAVAGAWHYFCKTKDRKVIIVHPDIPMWQVPDLKRTLLEGTSIFSIGLNHLEPMDEPTFGCERIFPFATVVLVTDDVFVHHPEKALEILNGFIKTMKGRLEYKIVTRPGIKDWLLHLAEDRISERGMQDDRWLRLYDAMCRLCTPEDEDPYDRPNPSPDTNLVSLSSELFPSYDNLWKKDEAAATEYLVEWFAGWTIENIGKLRKLYVLYEPKGGFRSIMDSAGKWPVEDPSGWVKKYQHIWFQKPEDIFAARK